MTYEQSNYQVTHCSPSLSAVSFASENNHPQMLKYLSLDHASNIAFRLFWSISHCCLDIPWDCSRECGYGSCLRWNIYLSVK